MHTEVQKHLVSNFCKTAAHVAIRVGMSIGVLCIDRTARTQALYEANSRFSGLLRTSDTESMATSDSVTQPI